jgi:uncharacterized protein YbjT (DUF2867 family)
MIGMAETKLVTGATGNVESEVTKQLSNSTSDLNLNAAVRSGDANISYSRKNSSGEQKDKGRVHQVVIDYNRPETIVEGLKDVDKLFVLTPTHPNIVEFTSNLANGAKKAEVVKHIVKLSHIGADAHEPKITITSLRRQAEKVIEESGIPYTFLSSNFFMQNFINFYGQMIKSQNSFSLSAGDGKVSFVDVRDIASVATRVLTEEDKDEHIDKSYDITGPESLIYSETADILSIEVGKKIRYINISEDQVRQLIRNFGMNDLHTNVLIELLKITRDGYLSEVSSAVEEVTGKKPISLSSPTIMCRHLIDIQITIP